MYKSILPLCGAAMLTSGLALADDTTGFDQLYDMTLEQLLEVELTVATRSSTTVSNSPAVVSVYTREDITRMGLDSLEALLNFVVGFQTARSDEEGRNQAPRVRGRQGGASGHDVLVLLDGMRLKAPVHGGAFVQDSLIWLENLKQVEIIRGPGSALYGANAFTAVINLVSDRGQNAVKATLASFDGRSVSTSLSHWMGGVQWSFDGRYYEDEGEHYDAFYNFNGLVTDTFDGMKHSDLYLRGNGRNFNLSLRRAARQYNDFINFGAMALEGQRIKFANTHARLDYRFDVDEHIEITPFVDYAEHVQDSLLALFPAQPEGTPNFFWDNGANVAALGGNYRKEKQQRIGADGKWQFGENHIINFGMVWHKEQVGLNPFQGNWQLEPLYNDNLFLPSANNVINRGFWIEGVRFDLFTPQKREVKSAYLQDQWRVNEQLSFTTGVHHDHYDDFGSNTSLRGGLVYTPTKDRTWKLLYGEAFRAPSFMETRAGLASGGLSNPALKPELINTSEFAWTENFAWGRLSATYYQNHLRDVVTKVVIEDIVTGLTAAQPQNGGHIDIEGIELEVDAQLDERWLVKAGISHVFSGTDGQPVSDNSGFVVLNYFGKPLNINLKGYYHGSVLSRQADGVNHLKDIEIDGHWVWSLNSKYRLGEDWQLSFQIDNLFDEQYTTYTRQQGLEYGLPARGRRFQGSIEYQF